MPVMNVKFRYHQAACAEACPRHVALQGQWRSIQEFWQDCGCPGAGKDGIDGAVAAQVVAADTLNDSPAAAAAETLHADASAAAAAAETLNAEAPGTPDSVLGDRAAAFASTSTSEADTAGERALPFRAGGAASC